MSDQCLRCALRGNLQACKETECWTHENWYALVQASELSILREQVKVLREALDTAKECLDMNGFGKAYVRDELSRILAQTKPKDGK